MLVENILGTAMVYEMLGQSNVEVFTNIIGIINDLQAVYE